jgi:transcription elongation factor GreA
MPASKGGYRYAAAMPEEKPEPLTQTQKEQLEAELAELEGPRRREIVQAIATARGFGDLSENFEYHAAKNEQGLLERRILMLRDRLDRAVLVDEDAVAASDKVHVGSRVEVERDDGERMQLEISSVGGVSPDSPVGRALLGRKAGDEFEVEAPRGRWHGRIVSVGQS